MVLPSLYSIMFMLLMYLLNLYLQILTVPHICTLLQSKLLDIQPPALTIYIGQKKQQRLHHHKASFSVISSVNISQVLAADSERYRG